MRDNILRYLRENELIAPGATLVCAVSGGKDSVCLLHMMLSLQDELQITVEAAHLNHRLRGAESDRDEAIASAFGSPYRARTFCRAASKPVKASRRQRESFAISFLKASESLLPRRTHRTII